MSDEEKVLLDFLKVNSAYEAKVIPGTGTFTFLSKLTGIPQVWKLDSNGEPEQFIKTDDRVLSVHHSPTGNWTVVGVDSKGNEKQQLYIVGATGENPEVLVESKDHFHYVGGWSKDGRYLSYSSNRRHPAFFDVFIIDVETREVEQVFTNDANCVPLGWLDNESFFVSMMETNIDRIIYLVNIRTKETVRLGKEDELARMHSPRVGKREGFVLADTNEDTLHLCRFSMEDPGHLDKLLHWEKWDMEEIALSPDGDLLSFTLNEGGITRLGVYATNSRTYELIDSLPDGVIGSMSWLSNDSFLFTMKTPMNPGDIWKYTLATKKVERLTFIGQSETVGGYWRVPELHSFKSFDGLEVPYFFYNQDTDKSKPAVIYVHGGPEAQSRAEYNPVLQYLVYKGFAVAVPNIRGSNGYGRAYLKLDDADKRLDAVADLASLAGALVESHQVLPDKIGIMGRSYGGFMVLSALTQYPDLWAAGVDIVGMSNLRTFLMNTGEWRRYLRECEYGSLAKHSDFFEETAPMNLTHQITAPLLVFHGRNDSRVPVSEAEQIVADLKKMDREVEMVIFEDEGHQTEKIENHITMHTKTVEFFEKHLYAGLRV
ncbi:S9 family peptidase [Sporosarcina highlanderae]|uniref:S9 family peptidase n=1 Tax=Sporosarcina highlanderae TaxID=3035916 RepID=A0ABT8JT28_9BACL|nr:S9 family peptidase [Sporosarcina highlanderae]MDN4608062.1 S9 family peptidase [Sporosarcina highlanderae]